MADDQPNAAAQAPAADPAPQPPAQQPAAQAQPAAAPTIPPAVADDLKAAREAILAQVPEKLRPLAPVGGTITELVAWIGAAQTAGIFQGAAQVPETDSGKPRTTPKDPDLSTLPPTARMARAYGSK